MLSPSDSLVSDRNFHHRSDNYIIIPRDVGPRKLERVFLASAIFFGSCIIQIRLALNEDRFLLSLFLLNLIVYASFVKTYQEK